MKKTFYIYDEFKDNKLPTNKNFYMEKLGDYKDIILKELLLKHGWIEKYNENVMYSNYQHFSTIYNTISNIEIMTNKDLLAKHTKHFKYIPKTYIIDITKSDNKLPDDYKLWFLKKGGKLSYGGWDVFPVFADYNIKSNIKEAILKSNKDAKYRYNIFVLQKGVENPKLINGYKFDFRVYGLSVYMNNKFSLYICAHALIRKSMELYDPNSTEQKRQLTNTTFAAKGVFVLAANGDKNKTENKGKPKISTELYTEKHKLYYLFPNILQSCKELMKLYIPYLKTTAKYGFQRLGFDLLADDNNKLWIVEVNKTPAIYYDERKTTYHYDLEDYFFNDWIDIIFNAINNNTFHKGTNMWIRVV